LAKQYAIGETTFSALLIGKDGSEKLRVYLTRDAQRWEVAAHGWDPYGCPGLGAWPRPHRDVAVCFTNWPAVLN